MEIGEFTEFLININIHPENYLIELPQSFLYESDVKEFTIPDNVTAIGFHAFSFCDGLTNIIIPDNVKNGGNYAFSFCRNLTSVVIRDSVTSISDWAFYNCSSLTSVTMPRNVEIGDAAFNDCGDKLVINYQGTKDDWKKIYDKLSFSKTYFTVNCTNGKIIKRKK